MKGQCAQQASFSRARPAAMKITTHHHHHAWQAWVGAKSAERGERRAEEERRRRRAHKEKVQVPVPLPKWEDGTSSCPFHGLIPPKVPAKNVA